MKGEKVGGREGMEVRREEEEIEVQCEKRSRQILKSWPSSLLPSRHQAKHGITPRSA